VDFLRRP
jgi:hypothetical protein